MNLIERLNGPQFKALNLVAPNTTSAFVFGRGVGKSFLQRRIWYKHVIQATETGKPVRIILLCPTLKQASDVYGPLLINELNGQYKFLGGKINKAKWLINFPNGSWIQMFGAENADNNRGMRADIVSIDEADDVEPGIFESIAQPWLSGTDSLNITILTGTPRRGRYGLLYRIFERGNAKDADGNKLYPNHFSLRATYQDAPNEVNQTYVESLRATMLPDVFDREWRANFDSKDGLVYPWREDMHIRQTPTSPFTEVLVGVDFGYEDPGVFLLIGVTGSGRDAKLHVFEEHVEPKQTQSWWAEKAKAIKRRFPQAHWFADPSQPSFIDVLRRSAGVNIVPAENRREEGVSAVADKLIVRVQADGSEDSNFTVSPRCRVTIREMSMYRRKRDRKDPERVLEAIQDGNDHTMDALRYAVFSRFGKPSADRIEYHAEDIRYS